MGSVLFYSGNDVQIMSEARLRAVNLAGLADLMRVGNIWVHVILRWKRRKSPSGSASF
jgi:hypothetical protein